LRVVRNQLGPALGPSAHALESIAAELDLALEELRELARGLHPAVLTEHGLPAAIETLGSRLPMAVEVEAPHSRLPGEVEARVYYTVSETLTNVAKHAEATEAAVRVHVHDGVVRLQVTDDGCGGADTSAGSGLLGLRDRAEAAGGTLHIVSPPGRGTVVTASLPGREEGRPEV